MKSLARIVALIALSSLTAAAAAQSAAPLGSPDYKTSPENPVGWRGDGTGRFPGATPPTQWSRRVAGITTELKYQADKPAGAEPGSDAKPLEYFTIKDWLVAGPFNVDDATQDLDKDFLNGEATVQPAKDSKAGTSTWKYLRADIDTQSRHECNGGTCGNSNVDFVFAFGKITGSPNPKLENAADFTNKVAYAHTYIYSPADASLQLDLPFDGKVGRFWLNGKPTNLSKPRAWEHTYPINLRKGWNSLLVKVTAENALRSKDGDAEWASKWMLAGYLLPTGPVSYQTQNINWMTPLTGRSISQPIIVGDRIFVGSATTDLMCIDKKTGKVLWVRPSTPYDALTAEERAAVPGISAIEPLVGKLSELNTQLVAALNEEISPQGLTSQQQTALEDQFKARAQAEKAVHDAFEKIDKLKYCALYKNEVSPANATPVSDGKYVWWACGGSQWSSGNYLIACFDLEGKRIWSRLDSTLGAAEHGNHASPILVDGKLIWSADKTLVACDAATGKELWRNKTTETTKDWTNTPGQPLLIKIGGTDVILARKSMYLASDGSYIGRSLLASNGSSSSIADPGVIYDGAYVHRPNTPHAIAVVQLPSATTGKAELLWAPAVADVTMPVRGSDAQIASPVCVDGILYNVDMSGALSVVDTINRKLLYRLWFDGYSRYNRMVYGFCASPTMAGKEKYVYITDDAGYTHILAPGPQFKEVARNILESIHPAGGGGNPAHQESFYTSPIFEGSAMYLKGEEYLYCIGGK